MCKTYCFLLLGTVVIRVAAASMWPVLWSVALVGIDSDIGSSDIYSGNQLVTRYSAIRQFILDGRVQLI